MKPDVSNMTLEVIEAIKNEETVVFEYGKQELRNIKPEGFFGDYDGFQGTDIQLNQFRRFKFSEVTDWIGVKPTVMKEFTITVPCTIHYKVVANNKKEAIHIFLANPLDIKGIVDIEETSNEEFEIINEVELSGL